MNNQLKSQASNIDKNDLGGRKRNMTREELKEQIYELMRQYADEEIDGATYAQKMMELTTSARGEIDKEE